MFGVGWQIFPELILVIGETPEGERIAQVHEANGEVFTYLETEEDLFRVDRQERGMVLTNSITPKSLLIRKENGYELHLGNGGKRFYQEVMDFLGEKIPSDEVKNKGCKP